MRPTALLVPLLAAGALAASDPYGQTPIFVQLGGTYLSQDLRSALDTDWGVHAGAAALLADSGLFGMPSSDLDFRYASSHSSSFTSFAVSYAERRKIGDAWWLGLGGGGEYLRVKLAPATPGGEGDDERRWAISGKAMLGLLITERFFVEGTFHYSPKLAGLNTTSYSVGLGYWF